MPLAPKPEAFPRIRSALSFYRITAYVTGVLLLLLTIEMLLKYLGGVEIELAGPFGFLALVPEGTATAVNLSTGILIVHGWFYVVYLIADFRLWSLMRWRLGRLLVLAAGGVVPFLSFIVEHRTHREVTGYLAAREAELDPRAAGVSAATSDPTVEASH
jgi:integral membrane protein